MNYIIFVFVDAVSNHRNKLISSNVWQVTRRSTQLHVNAGHHKVAHTSCIIDLHVFQYQSKGSACNFSTAGLDGQVIIWDALDFVD